MEDIYNKKLNCNEEQVDLLVKCSQENDVSEWNNWRIENPKTPILLEGAQLEGLSLSGVNLIGASLWKANLKRTVLSHSYLSEANLFMTHLENSVLTCTDFESANLIGTFLQNSSMELCNLKKTQIVFAHLENTNLSNSIVDALTKIGGCHIDRKTNSQNICLEMANIHYRDKSLLKYNLRRRNWEGFYKDRKISGILIKLFWAISVYGHSTSRLIFSFLISAFLFSLIFKFFPSVISDSNGPLQTITFLRSLYFSVVTMTTLGFGDIYASPKSGFGQMILMFEVLLGYILLGALITRLAILFTADGPSGKFANEANIFEKIKKIIIRLKYKKNK